MSKLIVVFVHGWSVTNLDTYGELPIRLQNEALANGFEMSVEEIFLGQYISFHDEVRLKDISRAFETAIKDKLDAQINNNERFICITHSTGGPVIRDWWKRYSSDSSPQCPMSHLIMLAPANFGSALAQLGKGRVGRLKSWFSAIEPGQGVLDWLELGSIEAWTLNKDWINSNEDDINPDHVFPFVLIGQSIDRKLYDNLNAYTGELGSDGVVRVAAANLESNYVCLQQPYPISTSPLVTKDFEISIYKQSPKTPLRIIKGKSHSGEDMGIMNSVRISDNEESEETIKAILNCINVRTKTDYNNLYKQFETETKEVLKNEQLEIETSFFISKRYFIHDQYCMVIFRVIDSEGYAIKDYDLIISAGDDNDPNHLPEGFFQDRQKNKNNPENITYYLDYDILKGTEAIKSGKKEIRPKQKGINKLGLKIIPRPSEGFVRYLPCEIKADKTMFDYILKPNSTTLVEIVMQRIVSKEVFQINPINDLPHGGDFKKVLPGNNIL
ncbi:MULTISPECIES: hypothetical protein [unclassified Arcicella]|uniref:esterase/lipase family protein n=1 Tax=unclassified Arcicella TaxID=2644986 RepID=UPI00285D17BA|nr:MULTISPECIES: hypothetical protein [unclassified Arcicella]MDR6562097.1 hypothetical protein [Arcicella sp. BE51]MDR6811969.1 hypothetical protein [Arcicella sp. BE140]MDR6822999.1 hypothetical protein [Arcicella sp. BE139]